MAAALVASLLVAGCSGDQPGAQARQQTPGERLSSARAQLEKSPSVSFTLESEKLPGKAVGVSGAKGTGRFDPPSFQCTLNATVNGVSGSVDVIAVEDDVYMKFFTPDYNRIDPAEYGAPNPAALFDTETGITSLVGKTQGLAAGERTRDGADVVDTLSGTLPGSAVADLLVIGDRAGTYDVRYGITVPGGELRTVVLEGPFWPGTTSTYTLRLKPLESAAAITRP
jgi:lipoprotein LprG